MRSRRLRVAVVAVVATLGAALSLPAPAGGATPADRAAAQAAVAWIVDQQQADGGFELAGFPGFETADAVLAIAEGAQTTATWSTAEALAAVTALEHGGAGGPTPIDALDDWVTSGVNAGEAAKLVVMVVGPLGLDPADFGPSQHDLAATVYPSGCGSPPDATGLFFLETVFVALGGEVLCGAPDAGVIAQIRAAQRPDGGWNYLGDPDDDPFPTDSDVDSTAIAVQALVAGGATSGDPAVLAGLAFLATQQSSSGAFVAFGSDDPNATAVATLAVAAAGFDPALPCWRDAADPARAGEPYADPTAWLRSQQEPDGRIASPNDGFGINTFATSQAVQALLRSWIPLAAASDAPDCPAPGGGVGPGGVSGGSGPVDVVDLVPRFTG